MQTCCLLAPSTRGTRLSRSRHSLTPTQTYRRFQERTQRKFTQVIWWLHDTPPSHRVSQQCNWVGEVLHHKRAQEIPVLQHVSVCAACGAAQLLHHATNYHAGSMVPVPSPGRFLQMYQSPRLIWQVTFFRCAHLRGRTISTSPEMYDSCGHVFASYVSWGYIACMYTGKVQDTIQQESFQQGQERKQET